MPPLQETYASIQATLSDYRSADAYKVTVDSINDWAHQFKPPWVDLAATDRQQLLEALDVTLRNSYWSEDRILNFLRTCVTHPSVVGANQLEFWKSTTVLYIQQQGESQQDMLRLLDLALRSELGISLTDCAQDGKKCLYVDDAVFIGSRAFKDITTWAQGSGIPSQTHLTILSLESHSLAEYSLKSNLPAELSKLGVELASPIEFRRARLQENRLIAANESSVLWPTFVPDGVNERWSARQVTSGAASAQFGDESQRQLLERTLYQAGTRICTIQRANGDHSHPWQPLGWSRFSPGFGSMFVTYRNCPNNAPLALWWSVQGWSPLIERKHLKSAGD